MTAPLFQRRRFRGCAEAFGISGEYDPACCRFPKSCSPYPSREAIYAGNVTDEDLEPSGRCVDHQAREFFKADRAPAGLAAARIGVEHLRHHGEPMRWAGSSYVGDTTEHRFTCTDPTCRFFLVWSVSE